NRTSYSYPVIPTLRSSDLDLLVANYCDNNVGVLLGNGDGSFQTQKTFAVGKYPFSLVAGDINGDGKPDLVVSNSGDNTVGVLLRSEEHTSELQSLRHLVCR